MTNEELLTKIEEVKDLPTMTPWAKGFCESISDQIGRGRVLSKKQRATIFRIFVDNNEEAVLRHHSWKSDYNEKWLQPAQILANYYSKQGAGYYGAVCASILNNQVPDRTRFLRMANNKYAKKVLVEAAKTPRFNTDSIVIPNSKFSIRNTSCGMVGADGTTPRYVSVLERQNFVEKGGIIIEIDKYILSAAAGAKRYKILPFGSTKMYWVEERFLKNKKKT